ncbi:MAG: hypothetical protein MUC92_06390 [Fimbriimonadaceae bacterium]|nr:hypothetical protein [Fimbriimonadaceae bacterium]
MAAPWSINHKLCQKYQASAVAASPVLQLAGRDEGCIPTGEGADPLTSWDVQAVRHLQVTSMGHTTKGC